MANRQKTYQPPLMPVEHSIDLDTARWLVRESFEKTIARDGLTLVDFTEREVPAAEVPKAYAKQLGFTVEDYRWFEFRAVAELDQEMFDWLAAEHVWQRQQYAQWLKAEQAWKLSGATLV